MIMAPFVALLALVGVIAMKRGNVADAVFYVQRGKIKLTVVSERGKEAVVGILEPSHFFGEGCLNGIHYGSQQLRRSSNP
jgi:CRP-like cAMP-binding protein